ncbi:MAG: hypothetical protein AAFS10_01730, partial [Myxococcota bacterium]
EPAFDAQLLKAVQNNAGSPVILAESEVGVGVGGGSGLGGSGVVQAWDRHTKIARITKVERKRGMGPPGCGSQTSLLARRL